MRTLLPSMHLGSAQHGFKQTVAHGRLLPQPTHLVCLVLPAQVPCAAFPCSACTLDPLHEGYLMPAAGIAEVCHRWQVPLIVDEAHGSHFCFHQAFPQVHVYSMFCKGGCTEQSLQRLKCYPVHILKAKQLEKGSSCACSCLVHAVCAVRPESTDRLHCGKMNICLCRGQWQRQ